MSIATLVFPWSVSNSPAFTDVSATVIVNALFPPSVSSNANSDMVILEMVAVTTPVVFALKLLACPTVILSDKVNAKSPPSLLSSIVFALIWEYTSIISA